MAECLKRRGGTLTPHTLSPSYSSVRGLAKTHLTPALLGGPSCPLDASLKLMYAGANMPLKAVKQTSSVWLMYTDWPPLPGIWCHDCNDQLSAWSLIYNVTSVRWRFYLSEWGLIRGDGYSGTADVCKSRSRRRSTKWQRSHFISWYFLKGQLTKNYDFFLGMHRFFNTTLSSSNLAASR